MVKTMDEQEVIIIGAGITGIGSAYHIQAQNLSYTILEQNDDLGGVWNTQRWHGVRCDSDIIKYSFSFMPYLADTELVTREQIHKYLHEVADKFGIINHIKFKTKVTEIRFDSKESKWTVYTTQGVFRSRFILNGHGYFSGPYIPTFPGTDQFKGEIIHSFDLDSSRTFYKKNVVLVGSGATAICCAPELSQVAGSLTLLQRSPSYIHEIDNQLGWMVRLCQNLYKKGIHFPVAAVRYYIQFKDDVIFLIFRKFPKFARWFFKREWLPVLGGKYFCEHFTPSYEPWEQRIPIAIGFKEQLRNGKIKMKTGKIERFNETSIQLTNGEQIPCDVCVLATGFHIDFFKIDGYVDGEKIDFTDINFFKGVIAGGIPNYFQPLGVLHSAWTQRSEIATKYALKIIKYMKKHRYSSFKLERQHVEYTPVLNANYILRHIDTFPKSYGALDLPSLDNILSFWFHPSDFRFFRKGSS